MLSNVEANAKQSEAKLSNAAMAKTGKLQLLKIWQKENTNFDF